MRISPDVVGVHLTAVEGPTGEDAQILREAWRINVEAARLGRFFVPPDSARLLRLARAAGFREWSTERSGALLSFRGE